MPILPIQLNNRSCHKYDNKNVRKNTAHFVKPVIVQSVEVFYAYSLWCADIGYVCMYSIALIDSIPLFIMIRRLCKKASRYYRPPKTAPRIVVNPRRSRRKVFKNLLIAANAILGIIWAISFQVGDYYERLAHDREEQDRQEAEGPWNLTSNERGKLAYRLSGPEYRGQRFLVYVSYGNGQGQDMAQDIATFLKEDCKWTPAEDDGIHLVVADIEMTPGVVLASDLPKKEDSKNDIKERESRLLLATAVFVNSGIESPGLAIKPGSNLDVLVPPGWTISLGSDGIVLIPKAILPIPRDCIIVMVGKKPSQTNSLKFPHIFTSP